MGRIRWWAGLFFVVLALALIGFVIGPNRAPKTNYRTSKIERGDLKTSIASTGIIAPLNTVEVGSQVSGVIKKINVDYNSKVVKKQVLAHIDDALYLGQVEQAKAQLERAKMEHLEKLKTIEAANATVQVTQAQLFSAKATHKDAKRSFNRLNSLAKSDIIADAERDTALVRRDTARGGLEMAKAQLNVDKAQLAKAIAQEKNALAHVSERQAGLKLAEIQLTYCTILSPINGEVIQRNVDQGQTVAATLQSPTLFTIAEDLTRIQVEIDVSEADIGRVKAGQSVEFNVDAFPENTFTAVVQQVRNFATNMHNVVTYKVIGNVDNDQLLLRPGMTANAAILVSTANDTLFVPNAALRYKPASSSTPKKSQSEGHRRVNIYVLKNDRPTAVPVTIGITDDTCTQIISGGVALGDEVIIGIAPTDRAGSVLKTRLFSSLKPRGS